MTFSIAGRCARTGMLGAVVTTSSMAVGGRCAFAAAGIGAVLTQHRTAPRLGPRVLDRPRTGAAPDAVLRALESEGNGIGWRQVAAIDAAGQALAAQGLDALDRLLRGRLAQPVGARAAVLQAGQAFLPEAPQPLAHDARANACGFGSGLRRLPAENHVDHVLSTARRQPGILVAVHSGASRES